MYLVCFEKGQTQILQQTHFVYMHLQEWLHQNLLHLDTYALCVSNWTGLSLLRRSCFSILNLVNVLHLPKIDIYVHDTSACKYNFWKKLYIGNLFRNDFERHVHKQFFNSEKKYQHGSHWLSIFVLSDECICKKIKKFKGV